MTGVESDLLLLASVEQLEGGNLAVKSVSVVREYVNHLKHEPYVTFPF